ncbi:hypothetical protein GpartN1_g7064.t1 [Galdieria partita]|nr:hypothetical protein GpartN1_g7064.t1 [Galdieria partita]
MECCRCGSSLLLIVQSSNITANALYKDNMQLPRAYFNFVFPWYTNKSFFLCRRNIVTLRPFKCKHLSVLMLSTPRNSKSTLVLNNGSSKPSRPGSVHTPESKAKISAARKGSIPWNKGKNHSKETREKISHSLRLKMADPKIREALRERQLGKLHSAMTRLRIRLSSKKSHPKTSWTIEGKGPLPYFFSLETITRINHRISLQLWEYKQRFPQVKASRQNRKLSILFGVEPVKTQTVSNPKVKSTKSEETKKKIAESIRAKWKDVEYRSKVIEAARNRPGKPIGEETKRKISQSLRNYYMIMGKSSIVRKRRENWSEDSNPILFRNRLDRKQRKQQLAEMLRKQMEQLSIRLRTKQGEDKSSKCSSSSS